jgi:DNA-binding response OmpR family regulator
VNVGLGEFYPSRIDYVGSAGGPRVLLAESDKELGHFYASSLRRGGHLVFAVSNGEDALVAISAVSRGELPRPDAIIMDLEMPIHTGLELLAAMRCAGWTTPVILMSAGIDDDTRALAERFEVSTCLTKPFSTAKLTRALHEALGRATTEPPGPIEYDP